MSSKNASAQPMRAPEARWLPHNEIAPLPVHERTSVVMFCTDAAVTVTVPLDEDQRKLAFAQILSCHVKFPTLLRTIVYADAYKIAFTDGQFVRARIGQDVPRNFTSALMLKPAPHLVEEQRTVTTQKLAGMAGPCRIDFLGHSNLPCTIVASEQALAFIAASQVCHFGISCPFFTAVLDESRNPYVMTPAQAECHLMAWAASLFVKQTKCHLCRRASATVLRCGLCKTRAYCSKECQRQEWKLGHKRLCYLYRAGKVLRKGAVELIKSLERASPEHSSADPPVARFD